MPASRISCRASCSGHANALLQTIENVSWAVGPVVGGVLTAAAGPDAAYWINAVSFLVSAVFVVRIPARMLQSATALSRGHWTDLKDGFSTVLHSRPLLAVLVGWGLALSGSGAIGVSEVFMATNTLGAGDWGYGLLYGSIGVGLVIGTFWSSSIVGRVGVARTYGGCARRDGGRLRGRRRKRRHLDGRRLLRRRGRRQRRRRRLQCAARPAHTRRRSRPGAHVRDERDVGGDGHRDRRHRRAHVARRLALGVGDRRRDPGPRRGRRLRARAGAALPRSVPLEASAAD